MISLRILLINDFMFLGIGIPQHRQEEDPGDARQAHHQDVLGASERAQEIVGAVGHRPAQHHVQVPGRGHQHARGGHQEDGAADVLTRQEGRSGHVQLGYHACRGADACAYPEQGVLQEG